MSKQWNDLFIEATKPHWDAMLRFAHSLAPSHMEAEDIHQSALLKALKAFPNFVQEKSKLALPNQSSHEPPPELSGVALSQNAHLRNWLMKIVKNTWLDSMPMYRRLVLDNDGNILGNVSVDPIEFGELESGKKQLLSEEERQFWESALDDEWLTKINTLNSRQKSALFLAAHDYTYKEISEILDIPTGTVMSTLSRTIQKLKKTSN